MRVPLRYHAAPGAQAGRPADSGPAGNRHPRDPPLPGNRQSGGGCHLQYRARVLRRRHSGRRLLPSAGRTPSLLPARWRWDRELGLGPHVGLAPLLAMGGVSLLPEARRLPGVAYFRRVSGSPKRHRHLRHRNPDHRCDLGLVEHQFSRPHRGRSVCRTPVPGGMLPVARRTAISISAASPAGCDAVRPTNNPSTPPQFSKSDALFRFTEPPYSSGIDAAASSPKSRRNAAQHQNSEWGVQEFPDFVDDQLELLQIPLDEPAQSALPPSQTRPLSPDCAGGWIWLASSRGQSSRSGRDNSSAGEFCAIPLHSCKPGAWRLYREVPAPSTIARKLLRTDRNGGARRSVMCLLMNTP